MASLPAIRFRRVRAAYAASSAAGPYSRAGRTPGFPGSQRWRSGAASGTSMLGAAVFVAGLVVYMGVHRSPMAAVAVGLVAPALVLLSRSYGGMILGLCLMLVLPSWQPIGTARLDLARLASLCAAGTILVTRTTRLRSTDLAVAALLAAACLSWWLGYDQPHSSSVLTTALTPVGFYIGGRALPSRRIVPVLQAAFFAGTIGAVTVLYEFARGGPVFVDPARYRWNPTAVTVFRPGGVFGSPPAAATALCFVILFGVALFPKDGWSRRAIWLACLGVCVSALIVTFTRTAFIALGVALLIYLWLVRSRFLRPLNVAWLLAIVVGGYFALTPVLNGSTTFREGVLRGGTLSQRESLAIALPSSWRCVSFRVRRRRGFVGVRGAIQPGARG